MNATGFELLAWGTATPETVLDNRTLAAELATTSEWIEQRCGVERRFVSGLGETTTGLAVAAGRQALRHPAAAPDTVICTTFTPDLLLCPIAPGIARGLGLAAPAAFDLNGACTGGMLALLSAAALLQSGMARQVLVIASDTVTQYLNRGDAKTRILFGDGAAALLLGPANGGGHRFLSTAAGSDGSGAGWFYAPVNGAGRPEVKMDGRSLFQFAIERGSQMLLDLCARGGVAPEHISAVVLHQANVRIARAIQDRVPIPPDRWASSLEDLGNTASASLLFTLIRCLEGKRIRPGDKVLLGGFGAGLTWAGALIEW